MKMKNKKLLFGILIVAVVAVIGSGLFWLLSREPIAEEIETTFISPPPAWHLMTESVFLWENGTERFVAGENSPMSSFLFQILRRLNLQAQCVFTEENVREIKENDKVIEMRFRFPEDIIISQWIEPKDRGHIKTNENGYRILENVKGALFILQDNLNEGSEAHILVGSGTEFWSCWTIQQEGRNELDKSWIDEINKMLGRTP